METITITVESRKSLSKGDVGRMRRQGRVPGVFYGPGRQAASLSIDAREFRTKIGGLEGSHLIQLTSSLPEFQDKIAILREVQRHPLTSELVHVDLYEVDVNKALQITVPIHFVGKAEGVTLGGNLQPLMREITVECLPREIPEFVTVDVSALKIHESLHVSDIALPAGVKVIFDVNEAVVTVSAPVAAAPVAAAVETVAAATPAATPAAEKK
ncbi:MAG: 50S ribosomal protein L25 [Deltaproteobacteria bacterium]|nr:50S ribosomal protein L25 [Deltaproteobacteria bacterium]